MFLSALLLTACTGREDIVLELDEQAMQTEEELSDTEETLETEVPADRQQAEAQADNAEDLSDEIYVHICGAVVTPGVYKLTAGSRAFEGVEAAGGFREDACEDFINLAGALRDGQRLVIPTVEEAEAARENGVYEEVWAADTENPAESVDAGNEASTSTGGQVNINTATESELTGINGIGEGKAAAIVQYRQENGRFASAEDIMKVSGIGEGTYEKIKDSITVE